MGAQQGVPLGGAGPAGLRAGGGSEQGSQLAGGERAGSAGRAAVARGYATARTPLPRGPAGGADRRAGRSSAEPCRRLLRLAEAGRRQRRAAEARRSCPRRRSTWNGDAARNRRTTSPPAGAAAVRRRDSHRGEQATAPLATAPLARGPTPASALETGGRPAIPWSGRGPTKPANGLEAWRQDVSRGTVRSLRGPSPLDEPGRRFRSDGFTWNGSRSHSSFHVKRRYPRLRHLQRKRATTPRRHPQQLSTGTGRDPNNGTWNVVSDLWIAASQGPFGGRSAGRHR
jgi:hypothetical protein